MGEYKGTPIVFLRRLAAEHGVLDDMLHLLSDDEQHVFQEVLATTWVPLDFADRIWRAAAKSLHPDECEAAACRTLGDLLVRDNLTGVYSVFGRHLEPNKVLSNYVRTWATYSRVGTPAVHKDDDGGIEFVLHDWPSSPVHVQNAIAGWLDGLVALCSVPCAPFGMEPIADGCRFFSRQKGC